MTRTQRGLLIVAAVLVAFAAGFAWQYVRAEALENRLESTQRALTFARLEATAGAAAVQAHRGDFEAARQISSDFFTGLQQNIDQAPADAREELVSILDRRDAVITSLSRAEPQGRETVTGVYLRYRVAVGGPERALSVPAQTDAEEAAEGTETPGTEDPPSP